MYRELNFTLRLRDTCVSLWDQGIRVFHCETKGYVYLTVRLQNTCVSLRDQGIRMFHCETTGCMFLLWDHGIHIFHSGIKGYVFFTVRPRNTCISLWDHVYLTLGSRFMSKVIYSETLSYYDSIMHYILIAIYEIRTEFRTFLSSVFHGPDIRLFW